MFGPLSRGFMTRRLTLAKFPNVRFFTTVLNQRLPITETDDIFCSIRHKNQFLVDNPDCVFISCMDLNPKPGKLHPEGKWMIFAEKNKNTVISESKSTAIQWTNELDVIQIIDMETGSEVDSLGPVICNRIKWSSHIFTVGVSTVKTDGAAKHSMNLGYFKTFEQAYFYQKCVPESYTGIWICFDHHGALNKIQNYVNGRLDGKSLIFQDDKVVDEIWYKDGKLDGLSVHYYQDGTVSRFNQYKDGESVGPKLTFFPDGTLWEEYSVVPDYFFNLGHE